MEGVQNQPYLERSGKQDVICDGEELFRMLNKRFFWNKLRGVHVLWSNCLTSPALCSYGNEKAVCMTLNETMLMGRLQRDTISFLLHEMIHAYLMVTENQRNHNAHGAEFQRHMHRINREAGTSITICHDYPAEHTWQCLGACRYRKPLFGVVRKVVDAPPGPNDEWWTKHEVTCGGTFIKVKDHIQAMPPNDDTTSITKFLFRTPGFGRWKEKYYSRSFQEHFTEYLDDSQSHGAFLTVKNHWQNLDEHGNNTAANANKCSSENTCDETWIVETQSEFETLNVETHISTNKLSNSQPSASLNTRSNENDEFEECVICSLKISSDLYYEHITECLEKNFESDITDEDIEKPSPFTLENSERKTMTCNPCSQSGKEDNRKSFSENRSKPFPADPVLVLSKSQQLAHDDSTCISNETVHTDTVCPICNMNLPQWSFDKHLESCLDIKCDLMENGLIDEDASSMIECQGCSTPVEKFQFEMHMEKCIAAVFGDGFNLDVDQDYRYDCPFCLTLYSENELRHHLSRCGQFLEDAKQSAEKVFLLNELFDEADFQPVVGDS